MIGLSEVRDIHEAKQQTVVSDEEYFLAISTVFPTIASLLISDAAFSLSDREKFITSIQAKTFNLRTKAGSEDITGLPVPQDSPPYRAAITGKRQIARYPKEAYGFPIITCSVPIINTFTGNALGAINFTVPQEKEHTVLEMAEKLKLNAQESMEASYELSGVAKVVTTSSNSINTIVKDTQGQIMKTDEILNYINSVANTTNLLGINAAIEAARVGEIGQGFNVVAKEIRNLAQNSKSASAEIAGLLERIKGDIDTIVGSVNELAVVSEQQYAKTQQIAANSTVLSELSTKLKGFADNLL